MADSPLTIARLVFAGFSVVLVMYGVYFILTAICIHYLFTNRTKNWTVLSYLGVSLLVTTMFLAASAKYTELLLLESAFDPVGSQKLSLRLDLLQQVTYSVKIWLADSLLIHRLWIVWLGSYVVITIPSILFIGSLSTGIAGLALFRHLDKAKPIRDLGVGFHSCSVALNVITTSLIAGRLLYQRRRVKELGEGHGQQYLSLTAVFAESGAIYSIAGLIYIPLYARNSNLVFVFAAIVEAASGIAPALIILRMALGVAVTKNRQSQLSTLRFDKNARRDGHDKLTSYGDSPSTLADTRTSRQQDSHKDFSENKISGFDVHELVPVATADTMEEKRNASMV
ncbi:hypothetical protein GALMADRAFT_221645 [Galerina marginata CBS 339.88]|uniref:Uncharacterized protein n=1 Tax=Galerina marginata (strain CBS 339.88) TaxID=685588 RepID=A0A067TPD5_GALM3|nr:hypothetical protein GALMADRAFT_221645 [Galerina marginata CBS 339.88]